MAARRFVRSEDEESAPADYFSRRRGIAWVVDGLAVVGLAAGGASLVVGGNVWDWLGSPRGVGLMLLLGFLYLGLLPPRAGRRSGQSLGKLLVGLRVTRAGGAAPGRARLLARALLDMVTVGALVFAANTFVPYEGHPNVGLAPAIFGILVTPSLLLAWMVRDGLLDLQLSERA
jgi:uncharacterized RDD family membrane protein YckC